MSDFEEALAQTVADGTRHGRLPGAAAAVRRGRRRSLQTRGGVALAGVAAVAGALGVTSALGGSAGAAPAGPAAGQFGAHTDDGILPATEWPGYDLAHWKVSASCGLADRRLCHPGVATDPAVKQSKVGEWTGQCDPGKSYPVRRFVQYGTQFDEQHHLDANEIVFTFPDRDVAAAFLADARSAGSPKSCAHVPGAEVASPGVSTADGLSWLLTESQASSTGYGHSYLVQVDDRVALLRVNQYGDDMFHDTAGDETVLRNLEAALER